MILVAILALLLIAGAVALVASAAIEGRIRRSENLSQIGAYGYAGVAPSSIEQRKRKGLDDFATSIGDLVSRRMSIREEDIQRELVSAGMFRVGPRRFLGYRALVAVGLPIATVWFLALVGAPVWMIVVAAPIALVFGWMAPNIYVHRRAANRLEAVDDALPGLIDLLVVTLEAGVSFSGALRMSAQRLEGPIGEEVGLTIQEQALGLSNLESLENWLRRCDTPSVRSFVRAMVQGDRLGVSIGQILRNQALELRARQKAKAEEKAQKAPIKILFPLVFLIFPAMFVVILGPALFQISSVFHAR